MESAAGLLDSDHVYVVPTGAHLCAAGVGASDWFERELGGVSVVRALRREPVTSSVVGRPSFVSRFRQCSGDVASHSYVFQGLFDLTG